MKLEKETLCDPFHFPEVTANNEIDVINAVNTVVVHIYTPTKKKAADNVLECLCLPDVTAVGYDKSIKYFIRILKAYKMRRAKRSKNKKNYQHQKAIE